jgi:hypothetical protein
MYGWFFLGSILRMMKHVHPDIVLGEPIPEIEPRINVPRLETVRSLNRWWGGCIVLMIVLAVVASVLSDGIGYRVAFFVVMMVLWLIPILRPSTRAKLSQSKNGVQRRGASDPLHWDIPIIDHSIHISLTWAMMISGGLLMMTDGFAMAFGFVGIYLGIGSVMVLVLGRAAHQPGQISCEDCSYPLVGLTLPCMCPECGRSLRVATDTTDFPRVRSPWFVRAGIAMMVFGVLSIYTGFSNPGMFYNALPSGVLRSMAISDRDAFEQLTGSQMTPEMTNAIIDSLIEESGLRNLDFPQRQWLGGVYKAGGLTTQQFDVVMDKLPPIRIRVPEGPVRIGEEMEISLVSSELDLASRDFRVFYFFSGFRIGDDPRLHEGSDHVRKWRYLYQNLVRSEQGSQVEFDRPTYRFVPESAGEVRVRTRVLVVLSDPKDLIGFKWDSDWNGVFETEPDWMRVLDLEATIIVE